MAQQVPLLASEAINVSRVFAWIFGGSVPRLRSFLRATSTVGRNLIPTPNGTKLDTDDANKVVVGFVRDICKANPKRMTRNGSAVEPIAEVIAPRFLFSLVPPARRECRIRRSALPLFATPCWHLCNVSVPQEPRAYDTSEMRVIAFLFAFWVVLLQQCCADVPLTVSFPDSPLFSLAPITGGTRS